MKHSDVRYNTVAVCKLRLDQQVYCCMRNCSTDKYAYTHTRSTTQFEASVSVQELQVELQPVERVSWHNAPVVKDLCAEGLPLCVAAEISLKAKAVNNWHIGSNSVERGSWLRVILH
jgi:hypothetical protein